MPVRLVAVTCHLVSIAALVATMLATPTVVHAALALAVVTPLLATLRGLAYGVRTTLPWLAVLLVAYIGGTSVEVVARAGAAWLLNVALLAAVLELGLVLALIRRSRRREPTGHE